jgi:hypothetical protein
MPTDVPGEHVPASPVRPISPVISVSRGHVVITGNGLLPNCPVTVRVMSTGEDVVDYLTYTSDADGYLTAALPETTITRTGHIAVTDNRPDPAGDGGLLWSNTVIVTAIRS